MHVPYVLSLLSRKPDDLQYLLQFSQMSVSEQNKRSGCDSIAQRQADTLISRSVPPLQCCAENETIPQRSWSSTPHRVPAAFLRAESGFLHGCSRSQIYVLRCDDFDLTRSEWEAAPLGIPSVGKGGKDARTNSAAKAFGVAYQVRKSERVDSRCSKWSLLFNG